MHPKTARQTEMFAFLLCGGCHHTIGYFPSDLITEYYYRRKNHVTNEIFYFYASKLVEPLSIMRNKLCILIALFLIIGMTSLTRSPAGSIKMQIMRGN